MHSKDSVSQWIAGLKRGELEAIQKLWERYKRPLIMTARQRLRGHSKTVVDEDDVAQSVMVALCRGAAAGRFEDIRSRDELWWLLLAITRRKATDVTRKEKTQKRGGGRVISEAARSGAGGSGIALDDLIGEAPTPEFLAIMDEQHRRLLGLLEDERLQAIATSRVEGYTVAEIATNLSVSSRSIERKLNLIRRIWTEALISD